MAEQNESQPDLSKPLSRWNAPHWAMMNGIAAALDAADWCVLCAIYAHLPNVEPGLSRLAALSGRAPSTVKASRKRLRAWGLIDYAEGLGGNHYETATKYTCADVRQQAVVSDVLTRIDRADHRPGRTSTGSAIGPVPGRLSTGYGADDRPPTGPTIDPKVRNRSSQLSSQVSTQEGAADAAPPPSPASQTQSQADVPTAPTASRKQKGLTDAQKDAIASDRSGVTLAAYLLHGGGAIGLPRESWKSLPPTPTHWAPRSGDTTRPDPDCSTTGLAGYIAYKLAAARVADGQNLKLPDISKLCGVVKKLRTRMTQDAIVGHIDRISANWPAIKSALSWMATPPPLDELLLHNRHVIEQSDRLAAGLTPTTDTQRSVSPISTREDFIRARREGKYAKFYANQPGYADAA